MPTKAQPLKEIPPGKVMGRRKANEIIRIINALLNGQIKNGPSNALLISDLNIIWQIMNATGTNGAASSYRGEYSPDGNTTFNPGAFTFGAITRVSPTNAVATTLGGAVIPGVYICVQDGPQETDLPNHPLSPGGETAFWHWLATWPSLAQGCDGDGSPITVFADRQTSPG